MNNHTNILAIDIGGTHIKGTLLNENGDMALPYMKLRTPIWARPDTILQCIEKLAHELPGFEK